ncbi:MAG: hypothetical protein ACKVN9_09730 [Methylophilaceae bacterium]
MNPQWQMRWLMRRMGIPGLASLGLLLFALVVLLAGILPVQQELNQLRQQLTQKPVQVVKKAPVLSSDELLVKDLATFEQRFSSIDHLSTQLEELFKLSEKHGLSVDKGQYALAERAAGSLRRFEVTFPVSGNYQQIRALVLEALEKLPAAALLDMSLEREKIADTRIKANLRFVLFVRKSA